MVRHLLTEPGQPLSTVKPKRITGHIASAQVDPSRVCEAAGKDDGRHVDYRRAPAEDFASIMIEFETADGHTVIGEATTCWSFVGAGLRLSAELLGPEYSMSWNTLDSGLKLFFSRGCGGRRARTWWRSRTPRSGQMPVVAEEFAAYGYDQRGPALRAGVPRARRRRG